MAHLILHIGSHKTGTTSIQHVLTQSGEQLERAGAAYLHLKGADEAAANANTLVKFEGSGETFTPLVAKRRADTLFRPTAEINVVSSETLFWLHDPEAIAGLAELTRARFDRVSVVAYLRRQDKLALSHRRQVASPALLPAGRFYGCQMSALPEHQPHFHTFFDYHAKLEMWREAFGTEAMQVALFEREAMKDGDSVADFLSRIGLELDVPSVRRNPAEGRERTLLSLAAKAAGVEGAALRQIRQAASNEGKLLPSRADAEAFLGHWRESNARLAQAWTLPDGSPFAFGDDCSMYPEVGDDAWTDARARQAISAIMTGLATLQAQNKERKLQAEAGGDGKAPGKPDLREGGTDGVATD